MVCFADMNKQATFSKVMDLHLLKQCSVRQMSHSTTKPTKWHVRPAKIQISLGSALADRTTPGPGFLMMMLISAYHNTEASIQSDQSSLSA